MLLRGLVARKGAVVKMKPMTILVTLVALACQAGDAPVRQSGTVVRDSAGIRVIENPRPPDGSRLDWRIGPEPTVSIGQVEGEEPYMLHRVRDATRLPDGRIVVANSGTEEVRVFDAFGTHLFSSGGAGEGPGEFRSLWRVAAWPGDSIVALDLVERRYSIFDPQGGYGRTLVLETDETAPGERRYFNHLAVRRVGSILAWSGQYGDTAVVEIRDGEGRLAVSLGAHPHHEIVLARASGGIGEPGPTAYSRELVTSLWGDLVVVSPNDRYEIKAFEADGTLSRIVRRGHEPRTPTAADKEIHVERRMAEYRSGRDPLTGTGPPQDILSTLREMMESIPLASTFPAFSEILSDDAGHLWVREYDFPQESRPAPLWTVFDPEGHVLGFIEIPPELRIHHIGEDYILVHTRDELDIEYVQVWPLKRSGG